MIKFNKLADNTKSNSLSNKLRQRRADLFFNLIKDLPQPVKVLDIGGTENYWRNQKIPQELDLKITLVNIKKEETSLDFIESIAGDACNLYQFEDNSFDVVFSNSVIEHLGSYENQQKMAHEVQRLSKHYFIQTPNRFFPLEPHFLFPFFQFLPKFIKLFLLQHFNIGWFKKMKHRGEAESVVDEIKLLSFSRFKRLFPESSIYKEKIFFITKSFVAYR